MRGFGVRKIHRNVEHGFDERSTLVVPFDSCVFPPLLRLACLQQRYPNKQRRQLLHLVSRRIGQCSVKKPLPCYLTYYGYPISPIQAGNGAEASWKKLIDVPEHTQDPHPHPRLLERRHDQHRRTGDAKHFQGGGGAADARQGVGRCDRAREYGPKGKGAAC